MEVKTDTAEDLLRLKVSEELLKTVRTNQNKAKIDQAVNALIKICDTKLKGRSYDKSKR